MSRHGFDSKQKRCYDSRSHCMQHTVRSAKITHIDTIGLGLGEIAIIGGVCWRSGAVSQRDPVALACWEHAGTTFSHVYTDTESHSEQRHRQTDRQTDGGHYDANSRSYCVAGRSAISATAGLRFHGRPVGENNAKCRPELLQIAHFYSARQHSICYRPTVRLSVTRINQSKAVEVRIMQLSPQVSQSF